MLHFFSRPATPQPNDLVLVHTAFPGPLEFRPFGAEWWGSRSELKRNLVPGLFLGETNDGRALWSLESLPEPGEVWTPLRQLMGIADRFQLRAAVRAAELSAWTAEHRYCGACGKPTRKREDQFVIECSSCASEFWPRVTPAVIMLVHRGDEILLARHTRSASGFHSTLAGFVEAGETLEEAVAREVEEEVGVRIGPPVYQGSQAWPFPHALMAGFHAPWVSGEPTPDGVEIAEAGWFRRDNLPHLPPALSIARQLIRGYFADTSL